MGNPKEGPSKVYPKLSEAELERLAELRDEFLGTVGVYGPEVRGLQESLIEEMRAIRARGGWEEAAARRFGGGK